MPQLYHFGIHRFVNSTLRSAEIQYTRIRRRDRIIITVNRICTSHFSFHLLWILTFFFFIMEINFYNFNRKENSFLSFQFRIYFRILDNQGLRRMDVEKRFSYLKTKMVDYREEITRLNTRMIRILNHSQILKFYSRVNIFVERIYLKN